MGRIQVLPQHIVDRIAAGEVIERPASVVKELIENALDAAARHITVRVADAGRKLIAVEDDGCGMSSEDVQAACLPHATSKIRHSDDLSRITTFGFRGEALASIAAVSMVTIVSAEQAGTAAWEIALEAGSVVRSGAAARQHGTSVIVERLFFNTPARFKFLKSPAAETAQIVRTVTECALAYPETGFCLLNNDQELFRCTPDQPMRERMALVVGREVSAAMVPVSFHSGPCAVDGYVSPAGKGYGTRAKQYFFVNRRSVADKTLAHAVTQAYQTFLSEREFPAVVLMLDVPPQSVDVNVHPAKRQVRFQDPGVMHDVLVSVIRQAVSTLPQLPPGAVPRHGGAGSAAVPGAVVCEPPPGTVYARDTAAAAQLFAFDAAPATPSTAHDPKGASPYLAVGGLYLVYENSDGLVIVDHHAAHERILFDALRRQVADQHVERQNLLLPATVPCTAEELLLLKEYEQVFRDLGFVIEDFGAGTVAITAYPALLGSVDWRSVFGSVLNAIREADIPDGYEPARDAILATLACHRAFRGQDTLEPPEQEALMRQLAATDAPATCPHGRPTMITVRWEEISRRFKRT